MLVKNILVKITILWTIIYQVKTLTHKSCCCYFEKDPFRGFTLKKAEILEVSYYPYSDKDDISTAFIEKCHDKRTGFSTYENIQRLKDNIYTVDVDQCQKECNSLMKHVTEQFIYKQEKNRNFAANKLTEKKQSYERNLDIKINENVMNLYNCEETRNNIKHVKRRTTFIPSIGFKITNKDSTNKENDNQKKDQGKHTRKSSLVSTLSKISKAEEISKRNDRKKSYSKAVDKFFNKESKNDNKNPNQRLSKRFSRLALDSLPPKKERNNLDMSFTTFSSSTSELKKDQPKNPVKLDVDKDYEKKLDFAEIDQLKHDDGISIKGIIERLELEIIYMKKKNSKPIDFIMNRFSIQDEILIKIIRIFESTLEEVITDHIDYITENSYHQFRLMDKLKIKDIGSNINIKMNKKF